MKFPARRILMVSILTAMAVSGTVACATTASARPARHTKAKPATSSVFTDPGYAFFFTPHQDDEVLSMGTAIKAMTDAGRPVYVVLLTNGGSSQYCTSYWGSIDACIAGRDAEFTNGVKSMGGIPIIRTDRMVDGTLTATYAKYVINQYHVNYPNAALRTLSQYDASPDHAALGTALYQENLFSLSQWYVKQSERSSRVGTWTAKYDQDVTLNMYPFGKRSVPGDFTAATYPTGNLGYFYTH